MWRDSQEHGPGVWGQGLLDFLQERLAVETAGAVCDGGHARLTLHTLAGRNTGGLSRRFSVDVYRTISMIITTNKQVGLRHLAKLAYTKTSD